MPGFVVNGLGGRNGTALSSTTEFYHQYFWEINSLLGTSLNSGSPLIACKDISAPVFNVEPERVQSSSLVYKFAKSVSWDDIKVTWYDSVGLLEYVTRWRKSVWTPECGIKTASEYKQTSRITNYLPTGDKAYAWKLINSWPVVIKTGDLTYATSDIKLVEVTVSYDWAVED